MWPFLTSEEAAKCTLFLGPEGEDNRRTWRIKLVFFLGPINYLKPVFQRVRDFGLVGNARTVPSHALTPPCVSA